MKKLFFFAFIMIATGSYAQMIKIDSISIIKPGTQEVILESSVTDNLEPFKDKDDAIIYFYRLGSMVGAAVKWVIMADNKEIAKMGQKEFVVAHLNGTEKSHYVTYPDMRYNYTNIKSNKYYYVRLKGFDMKTGYLDKEVYDEIKLCKTAASVK